MRSMPRTYAAGGPTVGNYAPGDFAEGAASRAMPQRRPGEAADRGVRKVQAFFDSA